MLPCHSCYICGTWRSKEVASGFLKLSYGGQGEKPQPRGTFLGCHEKTTQVVDY